MVYIGLYIGIYISIQYYIISIFYLLFLISIQNFVFCTIISQLYIVFMTHTDIYTSFVTLSKKSKYQYRISIIYQRSQYQLTVISVSYHIQLQQEDDMGMTGQYRSPSVS